MAFQVMGTIPAGNLVSYQLVYYADGLEKPGTVVGTNDGTTWVPGTSPMITIPLTTPVTLPKNFKGDFALLVRRRRRRGDVLHRPAADRD